MDNQVSQTLYVNIICQDALPEIVRCLDSVSAVADRIYIVDGGSTDGTVQWLRKMQDVYKLIVLERPFDNMRNQRNFVLDHTPNDAWVLAIDQDETLSQSVMQNLKTLLSETPVQPKSPKDVPTILFWYLNLINDPYHFAIDMSYGRTDYLFFKTSDLEWANHEVHCQIIRKGKEPWYEVTQVEDFAIKHWAFLLKDKYEARVQRLKENKLDYGKGDYDTWITNKDKHDVRDLPKKFW